MKPALKKQKLKHSPEAVVKKDGVISKKKEVKQDLESEVSDAESGPSSSSASEPSDSNSGESSSEDDLNAEEDDVSISESDVEQNDEGEQDSDKNSDSESDEDDDDEDILPTKKKSKNTSDGSESFANAFSAIIGSKLKAYDRKSPILARNKSTLKRLESDKLEAKAKKLLLSEKKQVRDKHRVKNLLPQSDQGELSKALEKERKLKKVAQRGVVKLFNAVLSTQVKTNQEIEQQNAGQVKKQELMTELSKEKFLDLIQTAGQS